MAVSKLAVAQLKSSIEAALPRGHAAEHIVVSQENVHAHFPFLRDELGFGRFETGWDEHYALRALASSHVLVNTGSSFALAASVLAQRGDGSAYTGATRLRQVHVQMPPKEVTNYLSFKFYLYFT